MPLIRQGAPIDEPWVFISDDNDIPETPGNYTYSTDRFLDQTWVVMAVTGKAGVRLQPADDPMKLVGEFGHLDVIEVYFPRYTDGRGYSHAQLLRRRLGYKGELRAVGHVLRDQLLYMHRSGFDAFETSRADLPSFVEAMGEYSSYYQPAADGARHVFAARHSK